jgi:serine phosphatase RsbU (regulator of sigma subunit)
MSRGFAAVDGRAGLLLYTDGLTEARRDGERFGLGGVTAAPCLARALTRRGDRHPSRTRVADFAYGTLTDDLCVLAARLD